MQSYIHVHVAGVPACYWLMRDKKGLFAINDARAATAFEPDEIAAEMAQALRYLPSGTECYPVPCDSMKIIPLNMRKVLKLA